MSTLTPRQEVVSLAVSSLIGKIVGDWLRLLVEQLASGDEVERTAILLLFRDLALGAVPPLPPNVTTRLAKEATVVLDEITDPDLHTLCFRAATKLRLASVDPTYESTSRAGIDPA